MGIEQRIEQRIMEVAGYLDDLPAITVIHNIQTWNVVYMCRKGLKLLDITMEGLIGLGKGYHDRYFDAEDSKVNVPKIFALLERNDNEEMISYFQQVKVRNKEWQPWLSATRIYMRDDAGKPLLTITVTVPVDTQHNLSFKVERLLEENTFFREHTRAFASLSKREQQILRLMAQDKTSSGIAGNLHLSEDTVKTHRRNVKKKIGAQNQYDVVRFAQAFDLL